MRIFRTCLKLSIKNDKNFWTVKIWAPILSRKQDWIPDYKYDFRKICPSLLSVYACLCWKKLRNQSTQSFIMNRTTEESEISIYFTDWLVQWSSILIVCRKVGSVYCLRGSETNLFGLPFVWDSVRQFNCVSDRYSYQSFSRDEIDLKWSSQE